jgi:3-oxoacyl-[acyl-carrier protein] reductase
MPGTATYDFADQTAIVTGSTKGIGYGIAEGFAQADANVVVNARTEADVRETTSVLDELGSGDVIGITADVSDPTAIDGLIEDTVAAFGSIDQLVNNAATWPREESTIAASLTDWDDTFAVNVRSQFYATKRVAEHMIEDGIEGSIVNITSQTGDRRCGDRGLYGISNTAINGLTWRMAYDLATQGIRMNAVSTDVTESHQLRLEAELVASESDRSTEGVLDEWASDRPLSRLGQPADIADAVLFLCSNRADYIVGSILRVSGGGNLQ